MPICQNCHCRWTWKQMFKKQYNFSGEMTCPYCGAKQNYSKKTKKWSGIIPIISIIVMMTGNLIFGPSPIWVFLLLSLIPLYFILFPFFAEISNEEEHLF